MGKDHKKLQMYGGVFGGIAPLIVFVTVLIYLSVMEKGSITAFWVGGWFALVAGLFLAKEKTDYCNSILRGLRNQNGMVVIMAWLFAGILGKLMVAGGLVSGLLWFGLNFHVTGSLFTALTFISAMLFSMGTGTSTGTVLSLIPVLYPAGVYLGSDPSWLAVAVLAGAAFGDNVAPISDTTIVSAYTQGATMKEVVKSRLPLALCAAAISLIIFLLFGGGGSVEPVPSMKVEVAPQGLLVFLSFFIVIFAALKERHIIEALIYGNLSAVIFGLLNGCLKLSTLFSLPETRGESTGLIEDGIAGVSGPIIFTLFILAITQVLVDSGIMAQFLNFASKTVAKSVRQAEATIIMVSLLASIPIAANAPAILLVGPSIVKPLGEKYNLAPARKANLMDCSVCTLFFILPWHIAVIVWYSTLSSTADTWNVAKPLISAALLNPYCWALLIVLMVSVVTGWNRQYATNTNIKS